MLKFYFQWRHERRSRAGAFKLPKQRHKGHSETVNLGSYLSQPSVRGSSMKSFDLPRKQRRWTQITAVAVAILLLIWIAYESIIALAFLAN